MTKLGFSPGAAMGTLKRRRNELILLVAGDCNAPNVLIIRFRLKLARLEFQHLRRT